MFLELGTYFGCRLIFRWSLDFEYNYFVDEICFWN